MAHGKFSRILGAGGTSAPVLSSCRWWVERAALLGEACGQWAQASVDSREPEAQRSIMGLCNLVKKHTAATIDAACEKALKAGARRLKDIQGLIGQSSEQGNFAFVQNHPLIRDMKTYSDFISSAPSTQTMTNNTLKQYAHTLRLSGLLSTLELRLQEAEANRLPYHQLLEIVFQDEINVREQRTIARRHKATDSMFMAFESIYLLFSLNESLELADVGGEFANALGGLFGRHGVLV